MGSKGQLMGGDGGEIAVLAGLPSQAWVGEQLGRRCWELSRGPSAESDSWK